MLTLEADVRVPAACEGVSPEVEELPVLEYVIKQSSEDCNKEH
jgi:hypothetical protein